MRITVFTPTFNRGNTLHRVYESLIIQTYKNFEWLIVDDGSKDDTKNIVYSFMKEEKIKIRYFYQENQGKHKAINYGVTLTESELFLIADSDDAFLENSLEKFITAWDDIENKDDYKGVNARCIDEITKKPIGFNYPEYYFDSTDTEGFFKYKFHFEKWTLLKTSVLREFPFPEPKEKLKFFPETVLWQQMSTKYKTRFLNEPLRIYYRDQQNATTKNVRYKENFYYWQYFLNNQKNNFKYYPIFFVKCVIGHIRDSLLNGLSFKKCLALIHPIFFKINIVIFYPVGKLLARRIAK